MAFYDLIVLGAGPGGYIAAIRASQLGKKVAIIEEDKLGGVCLNRGCIPTKALIRAAHLAHELKFNASSLGINVEKINLNAEVAVNRAIGITERVSKGVDFLMKRNKITVINGHGTLVSANKIKVNDEVHDATNLIVASGAHYKTFPGLIHDGKRIIGAWEATKLNVLPKSVGIIGAGAIGIEFAYFWNAFGVNVHIFEMKSHLLPMEDDDSSKEIERAYRKLGINFTLGISDCSVTNRGEEVVIKVTERNETKEYTFEMSLLAVGMTGNIENIGLENVGIAIERGFIKVDPMYRTSVSNVYAIGDVVGPPLLAHVASHEGIIAVEHMNNLSPHPLNRNAIPGCTYSEPQVASVGMTERELKEKGIEYKIGKLPFLANGKAIASGETSGFVKVLIDNNKKLLGAHIVGANATELLHEFTLLTSMGKGEEILHSIHPHPTQGEWLQEAFLAAQGLSLNA